MAKRATRASTDTGPPSAAFDELLRASPLPAWLVDAKSCQVIDVNAAALEAYKYTRAEFLELTLQDVAPDFDLERLLGAPPRCEDYVCVNEQTMHRIKGGKPIDVLVTSYRVPSRAGAALLVLIQGINVRMASERDIDSALTRLERGEELAQIGSWAVYPDGSVNWSREMFRLFDMPYSEDPPQLEAVLEKVHPDDRSHILGVLVAFDDGKTPEVGAIRTDPKAGPERLLAPTIAVVRDENGAVLRCEGTLRDVTQVVEAERVYRLQQTALQSTANAILITNAVGNIVWVNPAFTVLTGYSPDEVIGHNPRILNSGVQSHEFYESMWNTLLKGRVWRGELVNRRKDGSTYTERQTITPVLDASGTPTHFIAIKEDASDRNAALQALRESEERFRTLADTTSSMIFVCRGQHFVYANQAMLDLTGRSRQELAEMPLWEIVHPSEREFAKSQAMSRQSDGQLTGRFTYPILSKQGAVRWMDCTVGRIQWQGESAIVGTGFDITERLRAEEQLKQSIEFRRLIFEAEPGCVKVLTLDGKLEQMNAAGLAMVEADALEEVQGKPILDLIAPKDRAVFRKLHRKVIAGSSAQAMFEIVGLKGASRILETHAVPLKDATGDVTGHLGVSQDVTQRQRLASLNARVAQVLESVAKGAELQDSMTQLIEALEAYEPGVCGSVLVLEDGCLRHVAAPRLPPEYCAAVDGIPIGPNAGSCGTAAFHNELVVATDLPSDPRWTSFRHLVDCLGFSACWSKPIHARDGSVAGTLALYAKDKRAPRPDELELLETAAHIAGIAFQRHLADNELRSANESLELRVKERTSQLELAVHELEAFTYSVSHDLNAPLRVVAGFAQMLLDDFSPALGVEGQRLAQVIINRTLNMGDLITDLLNLSRASTTDLRAARVDMGLLVRSTISQISEQRDITGVELSVDPLPKTWGDPVLLRQVWQNLLANAVKFSGRVASPKIEVGSTSAGSDVVYWVKDNGAGFDQRYADQIFHVFQRAHSQSEFEGNGAGLAIVQRIVNRHGGRAWAESAPREGATFYFSLPAQGLPTSESAHTRMV